MFADILSLIRDFYQREFWQTSQAATRYKEDFVLSYTGKRWQSGANQLWIDRPDCFNSIVLDEAVRFFRAFYASWSILILPEAQPGLYERALQMGAYLLWSHPVMIRQGVPTIESSPRIEVQPLRGVALRELAYRILSEAYQLEYNPRQELFRDEHETDPTLQHCIALYDSHPAAIGTVNYVNNLAGIWNVGTRPIFRKRGVGRAVMGYLCQQALENHHTTTILLASSAGYNLYRDLGYETIANAHYMSFGVY